MCGICGIFDRYGASIDSTLLERMTRAIQHRGPDGVGTFTDSGIALGHRRLSIIDLEGGAQPLGNEDGTITVVFNGEIYNFIELRTELETHGHRFATHSDTEVIVHAYEQWGHECVRRFNGMFAFALWDSTRRELFVARDHLGIKPLYYVELGSTLAFASEVKALLQIPGCARNVDISALAELFTFRHVPSPRTLFDRIRKLAPGHMLIASTSELTTRRFWTWVPQIRSSYREADLIDEYAYLLEDAVKLQLRSDVPLGLFLSSGVDSGALLALMRKHMQTRLQTFTIGFEGGEDTNEVSDAREMANAFDAEHSFKILTPDDYTHYYDRYMWDLEEPVGNETAAAFYFLSKITSEHVKVALTGQGADEPWAGYDRYKGVKLSAVYSRMPTQLTEIVRAICERLPGRFEKLKRGVTALGERDVLTRLTKVYSFFSAEMKSQLFRGPLLTEFQADPFRPRHALASLQSGVSHLDALTQILYIDTRSNLPDDLLMVGDKTSMANSLEARVPFLDFRLVEFAETLPVHMKLRGFTGKYLHKRACERWLPRSVVHRKKKGFANPIENWFRNGMRDFVDEALFASDSAIKLYFDQDYVRQLVIADRSGKDQFRRHIYLLVSFELWHRQFIRNWRPI